MKKQRNKALIELIFCIPEDVCINEPNINRSSRNTLRDLKNNSK